MRGKGRISIWGKSYNAPVDIEKQRGEDEKKSKWGETPASVKCFKYGELGHRANECKNNDLKFFKRGKTGHRVVYCRNVVPIYYNCSELGHISTNCQKPKKAQSGGKVFSFTRTETTSDDRFIRGMCFINSIPLIAIIDTSATYSFGSLDHAERLGLKLFSMDGNMIVDTQTLGTIVTLWVCLNLHLLFILSVFGWI